MKKPLTFNLEQDPPSSVAVQPSARVAKFLPSGQDDGEERKQVGARIRASLYRQLKATAALSGAPVQTHVETAIEEYLQRRSGQAG